MGTIGKAIRWLAVLGVIGFVLVFGLVAGAAEYFQSRGLDDARAERADVIIVLSAGLSRGEPVLDDFSKARVAAGVELWREGVAPRLLMSGGPDLSTGLHLAEALKREAIQLGALERAILVEGNSVSTFENARFTQDVARSEGWRRAVIVSDDFHLLRAWALFTYWDGEGGLEVAALAPAHGRGDAGMRQALLALGRETLALPYNVLKIIAQSALDVAGLGAERLVQ